MRNEAQGIELARQLGFISPQQAQQLRDEMDMFPGNNVLNLMLKRHLITPEQLLEIQKAASGEGQSGGVAEAPAPVLPPNGPSANLPRSAPPGPVTTNVRAASPLAPPSQSMQPASDPGSIRSPYAPPLAKPAPSAPGPDQVRAPYSPAAPAPPSRPVAQAPVPPAVNRAAAPAVPAPPRPAPSPAINVGDPPIRPLSEKALLQDYLTAARQAGCSDLHLCVGRPPFVRRFAEIHYLDEPDLTPQRAERLNMMALSPGQRALLMEHLQLDFSFEVAGVGRHRCNVFKSRVGWEGSYRLIPATPPTLDELGMPPVLRTLTEFHQGLILVTGGGGSGKTTTVAAMVEHINQTRTDHIITVEDPVEYVYSSASCQVTQREVGRHTQTFGDALRAALRQDPDVIVVGEMRDLETTSMAISAAETGHLVFGTLHTNNAARTVARIMDIYPPAQRQQICTMVAESLRGIITQQLIPRKDGTGLVAALEILVFHPGVAMAIKEGKTYQLLSLMQSGKRMGMKIMDESVMDLFQAGQISGRQAYARAENKVPFEGIRELD